MPELPHPSAPSPLPAARTRAACTIVSPNYLPFARTLAASYRAHHPGEGFFVLLVARDLDAAAFTSEPFTPVFLDQLGLPDLLGLAMQYDILELNTGVKPTLLRFLLAHFALDEVVYLDPDIFVYAPLSPVFQALETHHVALTPHLLSPIDDSHHPGEREMLFNGTFNLGFIGVRRSPETERLLTWWERRCLTEGFSEGRTGLFVDQKWINLAPGLFAGVATLREPGLNMAYWNLHERRLAGPARALAGLAAAPRVCSPIAPEPVPLCFFHFSGIELDDDDVLSRHTDRFTLTSRPDLQPLFRDYRAAVHANARPAVDLLPYGFDRFSDFTAIPRLARRLFAVHRAHFPAGDDPFAADGPFFAYARRQGLLAGSQVPAKATWREFRGTDRRVALVHRLLRLALRLLGPHRYELLMRYLGHISVLRHQSVFLRAGLPRKQDDPA